MNQNLKVFQNRRLRILEQIGDGVAVVFAAPEQVRSHDTFFPYRQDSYFYYLTGFEEPESVLILDGKTGKSILLCRAKDVEKEIWNGFRYGPEAARSVFGMDDAYPIDILEKILSECLENATSIHALWGKHTETDQRLIRLWEREKGGLRNIRVAGALVDLSVLLDQMRLVKDAYELSLLKEAGRISALGHVQAMRTVKTAEYEYQLEAELLHAFMKQGVRNVAYESIVAGGKNACTLHYVGNNQSLRKNDLVLIDAGAEYKGYAGDITRTFPVSGRFTAAQKDVYEIVLAAQLAAIDAVKPGQNWCTVSDVALRVLIQGLIDLKLLYGSVYDIIENGTYKRFYMHGIGHWVGLDVHDVGGRFFNKNPIILRKGMCTTIEPGLYIRADHDIPEHFADIGIRIEDNVVVTETGCEIYTGGVPKTIRDIEALMAD